MNDHRRALAARYARGPRRAAARAAAARRPGARHVYHLYVVRTPERDALGRLPQGARHRHGHPLPGAEPPAARGGVPEPAPRSSAPSGSCRRSSPCRSRPATPTPEIDEVIAAVRAFFTRGERAAADPPALSEGRLLHRRGHPAPRPGLGPPRARPPGGGGHAAERGVGRAVRRGAASPTRPSRCAASVDLRVGAGARPPDPRAPHRGRPLPEGQGAHAGPARRPPREDPRAHPQPRA